VKRVYLVSLISKIAIITMMVLSACGRGPGKQGVSALMLIPNNTGANYYLMTDVIEEYGWQVTHTAVSDTIAPCPWFATHGTLYPIARDLRLEDIDNINDYDCLIIAPSPGNAAPAPDPNQDLLASADALMLIKRAVYFGLPVFATCAGVRVLAAADVVRDRFIVGAPRFRAEYTAAGANYIGRPRNDNPPTIDGNIITSARGQYYNYANVMAIATVIENNQPRGGKNALNADYILANDMTAEDESVVWTKTYGGSGADGGRAICQSSDGGYLLVGYTFAPGSKDADMLVIKTDADGDIIWSKRFGGIGSEYGNACLDVGDGYMVLGYTTSFGQGSKDVFLVRLDNDGNEIWSKTYGGVSWDVGTAICEAGEQHYYVGGFTQSFGWGEEDIYLIKIDAQGNEIWTRTFGGYRLDMANSIHGAPDGGCVIGATSGSYSDNTDFFLTGIDANGEQQWRKTYSAKGEHGHDFDWCNNSASASDGGFFVTGYSDCNDMMDVVVIKADALGNEQWLASFGDKPFYDYGNAIRGTADGGCLMAGISKSMKQPTDRDRRTYSNRIFLARLDSHGEITWEKRFGGSGGNWASAVEIMDDGKYLVLGHTTDGVSGSIDVCLMEIDGR
jgi:putative intracellular protease/amidase